MDNYRNYGTLAAMTTIERRIQTLLRRAGTARSRELVGAGTTRSQLSRMAAKGQVVRVARGLYALPDYKSGEHGALVTVARRAPGVLFCLLTALRIHDLTTQAPFEVWIAIGNKEHPPRLDYPPLRTVRFSAAALAVGVETRQVDGAKVRVTNVAKTVADCFKFRNRIGLDVALEALREGWQEQRFTLPELDAMARICRVERVMRPYVQALTT